MKPGKKEFPFLKRSERVQGNFDGLDEDESKIESARVKKINKALNKAAKFEAGALYAERQANSQARYRHSLTPEEYEKYKVKARKRAAKSRRLAKKTGPR